MDFTQCPACGAMNEATNSNCAQCRAPLPEEVAPTPAAPPAAAPAEAAPAAEPPQAELSPEVAKQAQDLEAQIQARPKAPALYIKLTDLYLAAQRKDLAIATLERCMSADPANIYIRHRLDMLKKPPAPPTTAPQTTVRATVISHPRPALPRIAPRRRRPVRLWVAGGLLLAVGLGVAARLVFWPPAKRLVGEPYDACCAAWSPGGQQVAFLAGQQGQTLLCYHDLKKGFTRELAKLDYAFDDSAFAWSPNGARLAYAGQDAQEGSWGGPAVYVIDLASGQKTRLAAGEQPTWSIDGQSVIMLCAPEPSQLALSELSDGDPAAFDQPRFRPQICVVNTVNGNIKRLEASEARRLRQAPNRNAVVFEVDSGTAPETGASAEASESPDAALQRMADSVVANDPRNVAQGAREMNRLAETQQYDRQRRQAAAGNSAYLGPPSEVMLLDTDLGHATRLTEGGGHAPNWTADGRVWYLKPGAQGPEIWSVSPQGGAAVPLTRQRFPIADYTALALTPDSRRIIYPAVIAGVNEGVAKIMTGSEPVDLFVADLASGAARRLTSKHPFKARFVLSPDGRRLVYEVHNLDTRKGELWVMSL